MASFNEIIEGNKPVLVDFYADWCGPCKMLSPIIKELATELNGKIRVLKVNVDNNQKVAAHYQIQGVPTMILFKGGKMLWRKSGALPKQQILNEINVFL